MLEELTLDYIQKTYNDITEYIGMDAFKNVVELLGEILCIDILYIHKHAPLTRQIRNRVIMENFNGDYRVLDESMI